MPRERRLWAGRSTELRTGSGQGPGGWGVSLTPYPVRGRLPCRSTGHAFGGLRAGGVRAGSWGMGSHAHPRIQYGAGFSGGLRAGSGLCRRGRGRVTLTPYLVRGRLHPLPEVEGVRAEGEGVGAEGEGVGDGGRRVWAGSWGGLRAGGVGSRCGRGGSRSSFRRYRRAQGERTMRGRGSIWGGESPSPPYLVRGVTLTSILSLRERR